MSRNGRTRTLVRNPANTVRLGDSSERGQRGVTTAENVGRDWIADVLAAVDLELQHAASPHPADFGPARFVRRTGE
jgi:hypothetical protein